MLSNAEGSKNKHLLLIFMNNIVILNKIVFFRSTSATKFWFAFINISRSSTPKYVLIFHLCHDFMCNFMTSSNLHYE